MTLVKICGTTNLEDALVAARAGADLVGFVFAGSPRRVSAEKAAEIASALPRSVKRVGVFVDAPPEEVRRVASLVGLDLVQLHGSETAEQASALGIPFLKAFRASTDADLERAARFGSDPYLLDGPRDGSLGLELAARARGRFFLAGGLKPETVRGALERVRPYGVDVARGVERSPGSKDPAAIEAFVRAVREWDARR